MKLPTCWINCIGFDNCILNCKRNEGRWIYVKIVVSSFFWWKNNGWFSTLSLHKIYQKYEHNTYVISMFRHCSKGDNCEIKIKPNDRTQYRTAMVYGSPFCSPSNLISLHGHEWVTSDCSYFPKCSPKIISN